MNEQLNEQSASEENELQLVIFTIDEHEFALGISLVREIIHLSRISVLPDMPASMVGVINVRGIVLPIVDLRTRFGMARAEDIDEGAQKVLIVEIGASVIGCLVDTVSEVLQVPRQTLKDSSEISGLNSELVRAICNLDERLIPVIDVDKVLSGKELVQLAEAVREGA